MSLEIISSTGNNDLAEVFVAKTSSGSLIELVESVQPPFSREEKWVLIVSTLKGCPVGCPICDAGGSYDGKLTTDEIVNQIDYLVTRRYPSRNIPVPKFKIQFARMGDPAFNDAVLTALETIRKKYVAPGLMPSISTVAPHGRDKFMEKLAIIKNNLYSNGQFQMQFSVHTTCDEARRKLVPIKTWSLHKMADYGKHFFKPGDRKITLNFAPAKGLPLDPTVLKPLFSPELFCIKLTPINPTESAQKAGLAPLLDPADSAGCESLAKGFQDEGFDTIISIGDLEENQIGSNCGMFVAKEKKHGQSTSV